MNVIPNSVLSGHIAHLLSELYGLMIILPHATVKKKTKTEEGFQIWYFYWSFSNDILAVKGLNSKCVEKKKKRCVTNHDTPLGLCASRQNSFR